jgi:hypothetical protein
MNTISIFTKGQRFRVKQHFKSGASIFDANEVLIFERCDYSPYDNCFAFQFSSSTLEKKTWWAYEEMDDVRWKSYFEPV